MIKIVPYHEKYASKCRDLDREAFSEMMRHGDVIPDTLFVAVEAEVYGFGYLLGSHSYAARETHPESPAFFVHPVVKTDNRTAKGLDAADMLLPKLLTACADLSYFDPKYPATARIYCDVAEKYAGEYYEEMGFRETDRMLVMEKDLTHIFEESKESPLPDVLIRDTKLRDKTEMDRYLAGTEEAFGIPDSREEMIYRLNFGRGTVYTADDVSFVTTWPMGNGVAATENIFTLKLYRRQGTCEKLLREVFEILESEGFKRARLTVYEGNREAIALYEKLGYKTVRTLREMTVKPEC